jgi:DNA-binding NtrC family response regulator
MKPKTIILFTADPELERVATAAVMRRRHGLRLARTPRAAIRVLQERMDDVDLIIVDLDHDIRGLVLLSTMELCCELIPVVTVTSLETCYAEGIAKRHGAVECLGKPAPAEALLEVIEDYTTSLAGEARVASRTASLSAHA